ncbi:MAG TPA: hypothetical protein VFU43_13870 [Streptosporangiaceae bacterium]|nr:hypothetical protein [Streptosporangiaceae bacterium]
MSEPEPPWRVRLRPTPRLVAQAIGRLLLTAVSALFIVGGAADPASFGGVLFLLLGVAGVAMFGSGALALLGGLVAGRPVLEIDDEGIRRPAGWPLRTSRLLRWDELAAVGAWSQGIPAGRGHRQYLVFLPRGETDHPAAGAEIMAVKMTGVPGVAEPRWSIPVSEAWDRSVDDVVSAVRRHRRVPFADRR